MKKMTGAKFCKNGGLLLDKIQQFCGENSNKGGSVCGIKDL